MVVYDACVQDYSVRERSKGLSEGLFFSSCDDFVFVFLFVCFSCDLLPNTTWFWLFGFWGKGRRKGHGVQELRFT